MLKHPATKYRPHPPVHLPGRQWPGRVLTAAPIWCSVDLRDGNQALAVPMNIAQKLELFQALVKCGFKQIEVGFPSASNTEFAFNRRLIEEHRIPDDVTIQVLVQAREDLIEKTFQSLVGAKRVIIHMYNSTSPAQRRVVFGKSKDEIKAIAVHGAKLIQARLHRLAGTDVTLQYSPESFSATEVEFAKEVSEAVMDVWQPTPQRKMILNLPDTVQVALPNVYADQIEWMCTHLKNRDSLIISLHTHNDRNTGTAATELGLLAGADRVEGTLFGNGERTGNLDLVTVALNLYMHGIDPQLDFSDLNGIREIYERCTRMTVPPRHPYAGELVFTAFSGSHQDAIKKGLAERDKGGREFWDVPYLTIDPCDIGREYREVIRVNSQSGKGGVAYLLEQELGVPLPKDFQREFGTIASSVIDRLGREVSPGEIKEVFNGEYLQANWPWQFVKMTALKEGAGFRVNFDVLELGYPIPVSGTGQTWIQAATAALNHLVTPVGLWWQLHSHADEVSSTASGIGNIAFVELSFGREQRVWGVGTDPNHEQAFGRALINAMNRGYPWCAVEHKSGLVLPADLRFEFSRRVRHLQPNQDRPITLTALERTFLAEYTLIDRPLPYEAKKWNAEQCADYILKHRMLRVRQNETEIKPNAAGSFSCSIETLDGKSVRGEGTDTIQAFSDALSQVVGVTAEIVELTTGTSAPVTSEIVEFTKAESASVSRSVYMAKQEKSACVRIRLQNGELIWGVGISKAEKYRTNDAIFRALQAAYQSSNRPTMTPPSSAPPEPTSAPRSKQFPFDEIEPRWQKSWDERKAFRTPNPGEPDFDATKPKFFVLDMFPYPSGSGLHVGHPEGYTATDIIARYKRMQGFNVLHPMGWDAFGLPAEQYAITTGQHPRVTTEKNVNSFRGQLKRLGFAYDWDREVNTTDPHYFKWTQWIFLQLYQSYCDEKTGKARPVTELEAQGLSRAEIDARRLAYVSEAPVNWCPQLGTVLANEEVVDGKSEVGGFPVERRRLPQWMLRITSYAQRLIDELDGLDWPESIKLLQRNWIGRSDGAEVTFRISGFAETLTVFTTRPDTLFGATYMVLAPEHPLVDRLTAADQRDAVETYRKSVASKSDLERTELAKDKSGVFTGAYAINPVNDERIPIWIADYVLVTYGTGAIMAVPAHDARDYEFAQKFGLTVTQVVQPPEGKDWQGFTGDGIAVNSAFLNGQFTPAAKQSITAWLVEKGLGKGKINYKMRDWLFSRQRYWGEPFPIVWEGDHHHAIPEAELPLIPPDLADFKPTGTPEPPLAKATDWVRYTATATRELNTMPQWAGSCWYYLRYCDAHNGDRFVGTDAERYWMGGGKPGGVDLYVGGTEHAVLHLLYARFWHKVLFDLGHVSTPEPFQKLVNQGLILGEDGQKMSKSRGNVVNPDDVVREYGADALRLYEMFMGPLEQVKPWSMKGVEGVYRFLGRVWRLVMERPDEIEWRLSSQLKDVPADQALTKALHETIKKCGEDIEKLSFNTAISQMMVLTNTLTQSEVRPVSTVVGLLTVLNPFAPHLSEELAQRVREAFPQAVPAGLLTHGVWPAYDPSILVEAEVEIVFQVNGKLRGKASVPVGLGREEMEKLALASTAVQEFITGKTVRKVIVVPGKLVNVVAS